MPLGRNLLNVLPYPAPEVCDYVRNIPASEITRREPHHHPDFRLRVIAEPFALYETLAEDMLRRILQAAQEKRPFVGIFPVGPTGQYPLLAQKINQRRISLSHVQLFFMDEYAYENGATIDKASPWAFERIAQEKFLNLMEPSFRPAAVYFPGPENVHCYDEMIMEASEGRGADVVYGGIGWSGHFAFWEPHLWEEFIHAMPLRQQTRFSGEKATIAVAQESAFPAAALAAWKKAHTAHVRLHPMTILHNSLRAGGDWTSIPPCAYTIGPAILLGARYRSFWLDADLGRGMSWQRFIARLASHGPVTPLVPASFLQTMPGEIVFLAAIAAEIGGPKTSWQ